MIDREHQLSITRQAKLLEISRGTVYYLTLEAVHAKEVIEQALARYGAPEIVNTDQGSQFTAEEFTRVVLDGRGAWRDNVFVERLWRSVKYERVYLKAYDGVSAARGDIAEYLDWYNAHRSHSGLERLTPNDASAHSTRPDPTYKSGKVVQTTGATSRNHAFSRVPLKSRLKTRRISTGC